MSDLELRLRALGRELAFPEEPDLVAGVRARLGEERPRRGPVPARRTIAVAFAALVVAVAVAFAVPPARTAILRVFGVGSVRIELVEQLPEPPVRRPLVLGQRVTLARARQRVAFPVSVPTADGFARPDEVYVSDTVPGGIVFLVYGSRQQPRALLAQFGASDFPLAEKSADVPETRLERVTVDGAPGAWIEGKPHFFVFRNLRGELQPGTLRLATNTLVWLRGDVTMRLEGKLSRDEALRVARSVR